jgi:hypothetical protein
MTQSQIRGPLSWTEGKPDKGKRAGMERRRSPQSKQEKQGLIQIMDANCASLKHPLNKGCQLCQFRVPTKQISLFKVSFNKRQAHTSA